MLMDLLTEEGCTLHYAGDFDPEGLGMAQRLLARYPDNVKLWRMDLKSYQQSEPVKQLDQKRLVKLSGIVQEDLRMVADAMERHGKAGYQEALVDVMMQDVREKI
ncbi:DUF2399 domain-containing protein [Virgibacillus natechei]|nr:DUF2399 domain-containing protein [Virgibacillus natechei]UZD11970.1 DUF2399 domain-containing protein [Virgibacillus natechei]